ncbi:Trs33p [Sporobolomyces salmoneus]|uniref:Trs33p n=1 Tax=Sporobolomyces salmoneus TaxID=183962 RepID=UPI00317DAA38
MARPLSNLINSSGSLHPNASSTSLISRSILELADPNPHSVDCHLFDLLLNETIRILIESTLYSQEKRKKEQQEIRDDLARLGFKQPPTDSTASSVQQEDEQVRNKIEQIGFKLGYSTAERLSRDRPRFPTVPPATATTTMNPPIPDTLELIKFVCKDLWVALFDKQVDNLRTNHRGVYVLLDNRLRFLERLSATSGPGEAEQVQKWSKYLLKFPEGVIRGALANLGIQVTVTSESNNIPQASFQIKTTTIKP